MEDWREEGIEASELPEEAWENTFDVDGPQEVQNSWMQNASKAEQIAAMRNWFFARYEDPRHNVIYITSEGGFIWGGRGPHSAENVLTHRFGGLADNEVLDHTIAVLDDECQEWATVLERVDPEEYETPFEDENLIEILERYSSRIADLREALELKGHAKTRKVAAHLIYSAIIGCLEAYLWEAAVYLVRLNPKQPRRLILQVPDLSQASMTRGKFLAEYDTHEKIALDYLNRIVWHRWDQVIPVLRGLGLDKVPSFKGMKDPLNLRNHIVHRNGRDLDGNDIRIGKLVIEELINETSVIVKAIHGEATLVAEKEGNLVWW